MDSDDILGYLNSLIPTIQAEGWTVVGSIAAGTYLAYTAGLTEAGLAELAISGLPVDLAAVILNDVARSSHLGTEIAPGMIVHTAAGSALQAVDAPGIPGPVARSLYGRRVRFVQLLWIDGTGRYPDRWPPAQRSRQPVYSRPLPASILPRGDGIIGHCDAARLRHETRRRQGEDPA